MLAKGAAASQLHGWWRRLEKQIVAGMENRHKAFARQHTFITIETSQEKQVFEFFLSHSTHLGLIVIGGLLLHGGDSA